MGSAQKLLPTGRGIEKVWTVEHASISIDGLRITTNFIASTT